MFLAPGINVARGGQSDKEFKDQNLQFSYYNKLGNVLSGQFTDQLNFFQILKISH